MNASDLCGPLHARNGVVEEAIKDVVHELGTHSHLSRLRERIEIETRRIERDVTDQAQQRVADR